MSRPVKPLRVQALWARVDQNRTKLTAFVVLFVFGSSVLITAALIALPATLIGAFGAYYTGWWPAEKWIGGVLTIVAIGFLLVILGGTIISAAQLSNAEDWVKSRFGGTELTDADVPQLASVVTDMSVAGGLPARPRLLLLQAEQGSVNAFALGTSRSQPVIGVTPGFLESLTLDEQRAVIATLSARVITGDIWFATALAALMGPLKAIREARMSGESAKAIAEGCGGCGDVSPSGCGDGCGDGCSGLDLDEGCAGAIVVVVFFVLVAVLTYLAVITAAWIVTLWGRALHRTAYEKADAEGMLLLKDPTPMLSALEKVSRSSTTIGAGDASYDGIFYAATSGRPQVDKREERRYRRLREVLGIEGQMAEGMTTDQPA